MLDQKKNFKWIFMALLACGLFALYGAGVEVSKQPIEEVQKKHIFDYFEDGGWIMWFILFCLIVGVAYGLERFFNLRMAVVMPQALKKKYDDVLKKVLQGEKNADDLHILCSSGKSEGEKLFRKYLRRDLNDIRVSEEILQDYTEITKWRLQQNIKPLGLISNVCPLLGLLGTVIGIIQAFNHVHAAGMGGDGQELAGGMAVALLTTCFGLGVAIPIQLLYHHLMEKATRSSFLLYNMLHELTLAWLSDKPKSIEIEL